MIYSYGLKMLTFLAVYCSTTAVQKERHIIKLYPISQEQYNSILDLTFGSSAIESKGYQINSKGRTLNDWRTALANDLRTGLREIFNVTALLPTDPKASTSKIKTDGHPLCVIKTNDIDEQYNENDVSGNDDQTLDTSLNQGRAENDDADIDNNESSRPVVSCVVVVKDHADRKQQNHVHRPPPPRPQVHGNAARLRNRITPLYFPPPVNPYLNYPVYPYYNRRYYGQESLNTVFNTARNSFNNPVKEPFWLTGYMQRSSGIDKNIYAENSEYQGSYYPSLLYSYGNPYQTPHRRYQEDHPHTLFARTHYDNAESSEELSSEMADEIEEGAFGG